MNPSTLDIVIKKYLPIVHLHPQELKFPCTVEYIIDNSQLINPPSSNSPTVQDLFQGLTATQDRIAKMVEITNIHRDTSVCLSVTPTAFGGFSGNGTGKNVALNDAPFYVRVHCPVQNGTSVYQDVSYLFYYAYNTPEVRIDTIVKGTHQCDLQHIKARFDITACTNANANAKPTEPKLSAVYFAAHSDKYGMWVLADKVTLQKPVGRESCGEGRIHVYAAKNSHASYPVGNKKYVIGFGISVDHTSSKGKTWDSTKYVILDADVQLWIKYVGIWGLNGIDPLLNKGFWQQETIYTNHTARRLCGNMLIPIKVAKI